MKRLFVDIQGDIFDVWNFVSAEADQEYNDIRGDFDYLLIINKTAMSVNVKEKIYKFQTEEERDDILFQIKEAMQKHPNFFFLGEDDGSINDNELPERGKKDEDDIDNDEDYE